MEEKKYGELDTFRKFHDVICQAHESMMAVLSLAERQHQEVCLAIGPAVSLIGLALSAADRHAGSDAHEIPERLHS